MSVDPDAVWAEVERRAAVSRFSGATAEDDDVLADSTLGEAMLNPNRQGGGGGGGAGGPGMMPPMMGMGGGGGGGGAAPGAGGGGLGGGAAAPVPVQPQAAAGVGLNATVQAAEAKPQAGPEDGEIPVPEMPGGLGGGGLGAGGAGAGGGPELPEGLGAGGEPPAASAGAGAQPPVDGFAADPVALRGVAAKWSELAQELHGLVATADEARLGVPVAAERPQQAVNEQVAHWRTGAAEEFDALVARLHEVAGKYEAAEESGAEEARKGTQA